MSDKGSEAGAPAPFVESDQRQTQLGYDSGGVPFYIAFAWAMLIIAYVTVMLVLQLPDFQAWQRP